MSTELQVSATTPMEMAQAQSSLIGWCEKKIAAMRRDAAELSEALAHAIRSKWKISTLKRHAELAAKRVTFYEKLKAALDAGYCIVPNFPITLFAIRTERETPLRKVYVGNYSKPAVHFQQDPQLLPAGEGEYKDPNPLVHSEHETTKDNDGASVTKYFEEATGWTEALEFPIQMAKPQIMEVTSRAMALKVFDQFGVLLPQAAKADPLIIGEIIDPRPQGYNFKKRVAFIIAWHLDTADL